MIKQYLVAFVCFFASVAAVDRCQHNNFPVHMGGSGNETATCIVYDNNTGLVIVGGNSTSADLVPAGIEAFLYALDQDSNLVWGNFYYNVSYAVD